jgi:hypothetical protein
MEKEITIQDIERRLAALEKAVASLTAEKSRGEQSDKPSGKFAHLGGIERHPARSFETPEKPIDFSAIGGKCVRKASDHPMAETAESVCEGRRCGRVMVSFEMKGTGVI